MTSSGAATRTGAFACFKDGLFWLAVMAAPLCWAILHYAFKLPVNNGLDHLLTALLLVVLVYPVLEEVVFRGALQGFLREKQIMLRSFAGISLANLAVSIVFTSLHFLNHAPLWAALVFGPSLIFGWCRDRFDHLLPPIALHIFYNAGFILLFA